MTANMVYASGSQRTLPHDLQRHITTKYMNKQERIQDAIAKFNSTSGREKFKKNLSSLPPDTRVKLFVNGIYNKFNNWVNTYPSTKALSRLANPRCGQFINIRSYTYQVIRINLDTIYYGYHLAGSNHTETPSFTMNGGNDRYLQDINIKYCPTEGHSELTKNIRVEDFEMLTRILFRGLQSPPKKVTAEYNKILYDFVLIVQMLATKYTKLKEQTKKDKLAAKEKAQKDKLATKEKAQKDKLVAKEKAQKDKLAAKEKAQKDKLAAKENAQKDKLVAKEKAQNDKLAAKEKAQKDKLAAKEKAKQDKLAAKEKAKQEKINQKRELLEMRMQERKVKKTKPIIM
jgi:hypothetical protein